MGPAQDLLSARSFDGRLFPGPSTKAGRGQSLHDHVRSMFPLTLSLIDRLLCCHISTLCFRHLLPPAKLHELASAQALHWVFSSCPPAQNPLHCSAWH